MGRINTLYKFFDDNKNLEKISIIQKAKDTFPNKSRKEIIAKLNYWEFATKMTKTEEVKPKYNSIYSMSIFKS